MHADRSGTWAALGVHMRPLHSVLGVCFLLSACAHASAPPATVTSAAAQPSAAVGAAVAPRQELPATGEAHALVIAATSCWFGGLWSDAVGEKDAAREVGILRRCNELLRIVGEEPFDAYYPLRATDPATVDRLAEHIRTAARDDGRDRPYATQLVTLFRAVADASRETVRARHAADKVKHVIESFPVDEPRANKLAAAPELQSSKALRALIEIGGPYAEEARVIGMLHALDRMEIARGLPMHLKIYAVEGASLELFGVAAPRLSSDAAAPIPKGTWLAYLTSVASAAGHPVPADAKNVENRERLAWNGVLLGFADKLRNVRIDPALDTVSRNVVTRLDEQAARERAAYDAHAAADR